MRPTLLDLTTGGGCMVVPSAEMGQDREEQVGCGWDLGLGKTNCFGSGDGGVHRNGQGYSLKQVC